MLLHLTGDMGGKDGLQPRGWATANDPSVSGGYRASKAGGELRGSKGKAFVPVHARILPRKIKCAMRKIKACDSIRNAYSLRMSNTNQRNAVHFSETVTNRELSQWERAHEKAKEAYYAAKEELSDDERGTVQNEVALGFVEER